MAFPVIETTAETATVAGTSHVVTLPSGIVSGDLILILTNKGVANTTFNALAGWTELVDDAVSNGNTIWARTSDGSEGSTVTFTSAASVRCSHIAYRISGAEPVSVQAPQLSTVATGTSATPDPTTCTPTGGAKDYLWIAMAGMAGEEADDDTWGNSPPTNFLPNPPRQKTNGIGGTNQGGLILSAERSVNAASLDPGSFGVDTSNAWRAYTIAVHPLNAGTPTIYRRRARERNAIAVL